MKEPGISLTRGPTPSRSGSGPGSICTTRILSGVGVPQLTAISNAAKAVEGTDIPIIADGGIRYSGDIALAAGAHCVMLGGLLAGVHESPGEVVCARAAHSNSIGGWGLWVPWSRDRANAIDRHSPTIKRKNATKKLVPEGVEGRVPYRGALGNLLYQLIGGLRAGMGYCGTQSVSELRTTSRFIQISPAAVRENHPHDIYITQESPNYTSQQGSLDIG